MPDRVTERRFTRYPVQLPILYRIEGSPSPRVGAGWTHNLSEGGACVELADRLSPETLFIVRLQTEGGPIELAAQVDWAGKQASAGGGVLHGLVFAQASPPQAAGPAGLPAAAEHGVPRWPSPLDRHSGHLSGQAAAGSSPPGAHGEHEPGRAARPPLRGGAAEHPARPHLAHRERAGHSGRRCRMGGSPGATDAGSPDLPWRAVYVAYLDYQPSPRAPLGGGVLKSHATPRARRDHAEALSVIKARRATGTQCPDPDEGYRLSRYFPIEEHPVDDPIRLTFCLYDFPPT